jgi:Kef-type K+ transport system membrane component KefB
MDAFLETLRNLPSMAQFAVLMTIILVVPPICERIHLPSVVGLMTCGILFGPSGLDMTRTPETTGHDLSEMGKLLLMFFAGMEIDLAQFNRVRHKSLTFGLLTFALPLLAGTAATLTFGYGWVTAVLVGSLLASHTLLGFPIVQKLGLVRNEAVAVTIGATIFTDIASLLVLAICIPIHTVGFSPGSLIVQIALLAAFIPLVLFGLGTLGHALMERTRRKEWQFGVLLLIVALADIGAEAIQLEGIVGAFLAGLAVNRAARDTEAKKQLEFIGDTLLIPIFFIAVGSLIDVRVFAGTIIHQFPLMAAIVGALLVGKLIAAEAAACAFGYSQPEARLMWSLSLPQVAATLAAALVAFQAKNPAGERLIDHSILNSIIVLMVVTSILGPVLTGLFGRRLAETSQTTSLPPSSKVSLAAESRVVDPAA